MKCKITDLPKQFRSMYPAAFIKSESIFSADMSPDKSLIIITETEESGTVVNRTRFVFMDNGWKQLAD